MAKIFGFASGETALKKPMVELLAHVRNLEPPAKSAELVAAEHALEAAKKEKVELHAVMMTKADTFRLTEYAGRRSPVQLEEIETLERQVNDLTTVIAQARAAVRDLSAPWRQQYAQVILAETMPIRHALHGFIEELDNALSVLQEINQRAETAHTGSPWICRTSGLNALQLLRRVSQILSVDRDVIRW
jgi:hypothetical protein